MLLRAGLKKIMVLLVRRDEVLDLLDLLDMP